MGCSKSSSKREVYSNKSYVEKIFEEIIVENFPNMGKEIATQEIGRAHV